MKKRFFTLLWASYYIRKIDPYQFVHLNELLLLLVQLVVLDLQYHLQTFKLLLEVHCVGVLLHTQNNTQVRAGYVNL